MKHVAIDHSSVRITLEHSLSLSLSLFFGTPDGQKLQPDGREAFPRIGRALRRRRSARFDRRDHGSLRRGRPCANGDDPRWDL